MNQRVKLIVAAAFVLVAAYWLSSLLSISGPAAAVIEIPQPGEGFVFAYDGYRAAHLGTTQVPDRFGRLETVEVVREEFETEGQRMTVLLYLGADFRFIRSGHYMKCADAQNCDGEVFAWPANNISWMFGFSTLFGETVAKNGATPFGADAECASSVDLTDAVRIPRAAISPTQSSRGGAFCFDAAGRATLLITPDGLLRRAVEATTEGAQMEVPNGKSFPPTPSPERRSGFPHEEDDSYAAFPWGEAEPFVRQELAESERIVNFNHRIPGLRTWSPILNTTVEQTWSWDVTVDSPDSPPRRFEVTKTQRMAAPEPIYGVEQLPVRSGAHDLAFFLPHNSSVDLGAFAKFAAGLTGRNVLSVAGVTDGQGQAEVNRFLIAQPNLTGPNDEAAVAVHNVVADSDTAALRQVFLPADLLWETVYR